MRRFIFAALLCLVSVGALAQPFNVPAPFLVPNRTVTGPPPAFWTLVSHGTIPGGTGSGTPLVSSAINMTGAKVIAVTFSWFQGYAGGGSVPVLSDSSGNTYNFTTRCNSSSLSSTLIGYVFLPIVTSSMTFTLFDGFGGGFFGSGEVAGWSGSNTPGFTAGQQSCGNSSTTTVNSGSITPGVNNSLIISGVGSSYRAGALTIASPLAATDVQESTASYLGSGLGWQSQSTVGAINPQWSDSGTTGPDMDAVVMSIHP